MTRKEILNAETVATWYGGNLWCGAEIKAVNDEKIQLVEIAGDARIPHSLKVYSNYNGNYYFVLNGRRISLNDCIRV